MSVRLLAPPRGVRGSRVDTAKLERRASRALRALGLSRSELSIALVDDARIAELNERYRGSRGATDVLSFSLLEGRHASRRGALLGDVVISVETAAAAAARRRRGLDEEVARLMIHGLLHLVGHDHERGEPEARRMRAEERRLWREVRT